MERSPLAPARFPDLPAIAGVVIAVAACLVLAYAPAQAETPEGRG